MMMTVHEAHKIMRTNNQIMREDAANVITQEIAYEINEDMCEDELTRLYDWVCDRTWRSQDTIKTVAVEWAHHIA